MTVHEIVLDIQEAQDLSLAVNFLLHQPKNIIRETISILIISDWETLMQLYKTAQEEKQKQEILRNIATFAESKKHEQGIRNIFTMLEEISP